MGMIYMNGKPFSGSIEGKSAYESYLETVSDGDTPLTEEEWVNSFKEIDDSQTSSTTTWSSEKVNEEFSKKVNSEDGKGLSTNDLTNALLESINNILGTENSNVTPLQILSGLLTGNLDNYVTGTIKPDTDFSTLENGIYTITTSVRLSHSDFKPTNNSAPPDGVIYYNNPGGLIFIIDTPTLDNFVTVHTFTNGIQSNTNYGLYRCPMKLMIFLDSDGVLAYRTRTATRLNVNVTSSASGSSAVNEPVYSLSDWKYFHTDLTPQYIRKGIKTISSEVVATEDSPLTVVTISGIIGYPYTTGYLIGPACAKLTMTQNGTSSVFKVVSGTFPAGTYYYELE